MNHIVKEEFFDKFTCIADKCSFTCCKGWEVSVDAGTRDQWKENAKEYESVCNNLRMIQGEGGPEYYIDMGAYKSCPFLNDKGLCNIVIHYGNGALPDTCKTYPRQENDLGIIKEYSLSCGCPVVVDLMNDLVGKVRFFNADKEVSMDIPKDTFQDASVDISKGVTMDTSKGVTVDTSTDIILDSLPMGYKVREIMISIMQNNKFTLRDRMLLIAHALFQWKQEQIPNEDILSKYRDESYLLSVKATWSGVPINPRDSWAEMNELFLDIVENYRKEKNFQYYLKDLWKLAENLDEETGHIGWNAFDKVFEQYNNLIENSIVSKIFSNCTNDDADEMLISYQMVLMEYLMIKYASFLKWMLNHKSSMDYTDIRNHIVIFSRIIGYNTDGILEFLEDCFDQPYLEFGYILLLMK